MKSAAIGIMGSIPKIRLYDIFRKDLHLPDERAHDLVQTIDEAVKEGYEENLKRIATREFVKDQVQSVKEFVKDQNYATKEFVRDEIRSVKEFVKSQNYATKEFVKEEINRVELKVEQTKGDLKSELTKSIYVSSLIQVLAIVGSIIGIITFIFRK